MSIEQYLKMSDDELKNFTAYNFGEEYNDPFIHSVLRHGPAKEELLDEDEFEQEEILEDLLDIPVDNKLYDEDYIDFDNIEQ
jgi:2-keto-3-deoxy-galactonokinase